MNRKALGITVLILTLVAFATLTQGIAHAAPPEQDAPPADVAPAPRLHIQISQRVPLTISVPTTNAAPVTDTLTDTVTGTVASTVTSPISAAQVMTYVLDLMLDFEVDSALTDTMTMTAPSTVTIMMADGMSITLPISLEVSLDASALVTVTALPAPTEEITAAAEITESVELTAGEEITATPGVTETPGVTDTGAITGVAPIGTTTTVTANLRSGPGSDFEVVGTVAPSTPITPVATSADGAWYLLDEAAWIFGDLIANPPANLPVADDALIQQVTEEAAARATPTPTPEPEPEPEPEPTATPVPETAAIPPTVNVNANLRAGPGTNFPQTGGTITGQTINIIGQNAAGDWYLLDNGGWVFANLVNNAPADIPVVPDDATPQSLGVTPAAQGPQLPTPTPRPTATPALDADETAYLDAARDFIGQYGVNGAKLAALGNSALADNGQLQSTNWQNAIISEAAVLRAIGEQVRELDVPPIFAAAQIDLVAAANAFDQAANLAEQGANTGSLNSVQQSVAQLGEAESRLASATGKLDAVAP